MLTSICRSQLSDANNDFPFSNHATRGEDCNVAMTSEAIELVTGTELSALTLRATTGQLTGPTGSVLARRAYADAGMRAQVDYRMLTRVPTQDVRDLLSGGWYVVLFIDYGRLRAEAPDIIGDRAYSGAHAIALADWWRGRAGRQVHYIDPLADGRKRGAWVAPKGVQSTRFAHVRNAGYAYNGGALVLSGHAVKP